MQINMTRVVYGPWTLRVDVAETEAAYRQLGPTGADECGCITCRNFALIRDEVYPPEVLDLFSSLGVDFLKEDEVIHFNRLPSGLNSYMGWFFFCGGVESGPDAWVQTKAGTMQPEFLPVTDTFKIGFTRIDGAPDYFSELPCVQLEFSAELPWRLYATEPD